MPQPTTALSGGSAAPKILGKTKEGRSIVQNPDGSVSTERTITVETDGGYMNIPTMFNGRQVSPREAIQIIRENGGVDPETKKKLDVHESIDAAETAAKARSKALNDEMKALGIY